MLTVEKLKAMESWEIFAQGELYDHYEKHPSLVSCNLATTGKVTRRVAVRGNGYHDWTVYAQNPHYIDSTDPDTIAYWLTGVWDWQRIADVGDKVGEFNARKLVPCDDQAADLYRN